MKKLRVFISSVQSEFSEERQMLFDYLISDALLGLFFEPFIFEKIPANNHLASTIYLTEVEQCDIYIGLLGKEYGYEDSEGISPTEREFDHAGLLHKTRLIFISHHDSSERNPKEAALIEKAEQLVVRKQISSIQDLKAATYSSLIRYLEETEHIRTAPFDATLNKEATIDDLDADKIQNFVTLSKSKRNFPLSIDSSPKTILTHLNLLKDNCVSNAAILLFGKQPQRFFLASEIRCAHFHGKEITKPIPSYQVYKGDVFQLVDKAVDFVLSKINLEVGTRDEDTHVPVNYEIPRAAVAEAIVNAVAHRDYTSNGSVQIMLFKDRLEIWNPGHLPFGLTPDKLRKPHNSIPANLLLAEPMYLAGYIERMGTGTGDIIRWCKEAGLEKAPEFVQEEIFKTIIWRKNVEETGQVAGQLTGQVTGQVKDDTLECIKRVVWAINDDIKRAEIQEFLGLKRRETVIENYINPAIQQGYIAMKYPNSPNHPQQHYILTVKGKLLKDETGQVAGQLTEQVTGQVRDDTLECIKRVVWAINDDIKRAEIQEFLGLKRRETVIENYINPAIQQGYIAMKYPNSPNHPQQHYILTVKGKLLKDETGQLPEQVTGQVTGQVTDETMEYIQKTVWVIDEDAKRTDIQKLIGLKHRENFIDNYLNPAIQQGYVTMKYPNNLNHPQQRYRLTDKGKSLKENLILKLKKNKQ